MTHLDYQDDQVQDSVKARAKIKLERDLGPVIMGALADPKTVEIMLNADGKLFWNNAAITREELATRIATAVEKKPQPELQLRADKSTRYEVIAQVMAAAQTGGMTKIGFVTDPKDAGK